MILYDIYKNLYQEKPRISKNAKNKFFCKKLLTSRARCVNIIELSEITDSDTQSKGLIYNDREGKSTIKEYISGSKNLYLKTEFGS